MSGPSVPTAQQVDPGSLYQYQQPGIADYGAAASMKDLFRVDPARKMQDTYNWMARNAMNDPNTGGMQQTGQAGQNQFNLGNYYADQGQNFGSDSLQGMADLSNAYQNGTAYNSAGVLDASAQAFGNAKSLYDLGGQTTGYGWQTGGLGNRVAGTAQNFYDAGQGVMNTAPTFYNAGQGVMNTAPTFYNAGQGVMDQGSRIGAYGADVANTAQQFDNTGILAGNQSTPLFNQADKLFGKADPLYAAGDSLRPYANDALQAGFDPQKNYYDQQFQQNTDQTRATLAAQGLGTSAYGSQVEGDSDRRFNTAFGHDQLARMQQGAQTANSLLGQMGALYGQGAGQIQAGGAMNAQGREALMQSANLFGQGNQALTQAGNLMAQGANVTNTGAGIYDMGNRALGQGAAIYGQGNQVVGQGAGIYNMGNQTLGQAGDLYNRAAGINATGAGIYGQGGQQAQLGASLGQSVPAAQMAALQAYMGGQQNTGNMRTQFGQAAGQAGQMGTNLSQAPFNFQQQLMANAAKNGTMANQNTQQQIADFLAYLQGTTNANNLLIGANNSNNVGALASETQANTQNQQFLGMLGGGLRTAGNWLGL